MVKVGYFVKLEAKPDAVDDVAAILVGARATIERETTTPVWLALRLGPTTFAVVDAFADDADRQCHLRANGAELAAVSPLLAEAPSLVSTDVIAAKLPSQPA